MPQPVGASYRDRGGRIYDLDGRIVRSVMPSAAGAYEAVRDAGLYDRWIGRGDLVGIEEVAAPFQLDGEQPAYWLEHPRLPFVSHPYEWSFSLLKKAALLQLDLHLEALAAGFSMSDATAFNVQFDGVRPVFIDQLSFRPYRDGEVWVGHRQFVMQYLGPLILWSRLGIAPNAWFRGNLEGIPPEDLSALLPWHGGWSWTALAHVKAQAAVQKRRTKAGWQAEAHKERQLSKIGLEAMLSGLRRHIAGLQPVGGATVWSDYAGQTSYAEPEAEAKRAFVARMAAAVRPGLMFDFGCNSGDYSFAALNGGAGRVIGFDFDFGALEKAVARAEASNAPLTPLWLDAVNPSPAQGWAEAERAGFGSRARGDAMVALALIHHICIGRNVPMAMCIDWLMATAPHGIIEFPPKSDPMVRQLLASREDIFDDYSEESFIAEVTRRGRIVDQQHLSEGGRLLVRYER